jgi:amino acid transporter
MPRQWIWIFLYTDVFFLPRINCGWYHHQVLERAHQRRCLGRCVLRLSRAYSILRGSWLWRRLVLALERTIDIFRLTTFPPLVEYVLGIIKIIACAGFIIFGIVVDCGGIPGDDRGYIGAKYWHDPGAFRNGFKGFCTVFVTAAFAFSGTELAGLAAAEAENPAKSLPRATKQVFWRIFFFYIVNTFILGLILRSDDDRLLGASGANTKASPFVLAIQAAGVKGLPSVFNAVITIAVLSVANSATFGSTRTFQALAQAGMAPKILAYVDKKGRPLPTVALQLAFALLAFINCAPSVGTQFFNWLLALSGVASFFTWGSICLAHIRFRAAWKYSGHEVAELPFRAFAGVIGSYIGLALNIICLVAQFYVAAWPIGEAKLSATERVKGFFSAFLAAPLIIVLFLVWKLISITSKDERLNHRGWKLYLKAHEIDVNSGIREGVLRHPDDVAAEIEGKRNRTTGQKAMAPFKAIWEGLFAP